MTSFNLETIFAQTIGLIFIPRQNLIETVMYMRRTLQVIKQLARIETNAATAHTNETGCKVIVVLGEEVLSPRHASVLFRLEDVIGEWRMRVEGLATIGAQEHRVVVCLHAKCILTGNLHIRASRALARTLPDSDA